MPNTDLWTAATLIALAVPIANAQTTAARPDRFGDVMRIALPVVAAGWSVYRSDMEGVEQLALSLGVSQLATEGLKRIVNDPRPTGPGLGFVSGHTSAAFVSAAYAQRRYGFESSIPLYVLATATAYSRVETGHHYTRQVLGGAAIGVGSAYFLTTRLSGGSQATLASTGRGLVFNYAAQW